MPEDLPIYSEKPLRTGLQFAELERLKGFDVSQVYPQADAWISAFEGATGVTAARESLTAVSKDGLLRVHSLLFPDRPGAGQWRQTSLKPLYRGQDCAPPEFIERSVENLMKWCRRSLRPAAPMVSGWSVDQRPNLSRRSLISRTIEPC